MNYNYYKYCMVPQCKSTSVKTPNKLFIYVPHNPQIREKWLTLARRDDTRSLSTKSRMYFCEDHFDLPKDMENYTEYHIMGSVRQVRLNPNSLPSKFSCQQDRLNEAIQNITRPFCNKILFMTTKHKEEMPAEDSNTASTSAMNNTVASNTDKNLGLCFVCFAVDRQCFDISNTHLLHFYEEIVCENVQNISMCLCYICHTKLQQCYQLKQLAEQTQNLDVEVQNNWKFSTVNVVNYSIPDNKVEIELIPTSNVKVFEVKKYGVSIENGPELDESDSKMFEVKIEENHDNLTSSGDEQNLDMKEKKYSEKIKDLKEKKEFQRELSCDRSKTEIKRKSSNLKCDICQQTFVHKNALNKHRYYHMNYKKFSCDVCPQKFTLKTNLTIHMRIHTGDKPYSCDLCDRKFVQRNSLISHKRSHLGEKPFTCDICWKKFSSKSNLAEHKKTHTGDKPFNCDICQKKFTQKSGLKTHIKRHLGEKPFTCDICQRKLSSKNNLKVHLLTHTGDKPYACDICQRQFSQKSNMRSHIKSHSEDKRFSCDICPQKFPFQSSLTAHKVIHTGNKPYNCDICQQKFTQKSSQARHMKSHII